MKGWVYVISTETHDLLKIGFTNRDPKERAGEFSSDTSSPHPHKVEYAVLVENAYAIEQSVHRKMSASREGKEWFNCSLIEAVHSIKAVAGDSILYEDSPFKLQEEIEERKKQEQQEQQERRDQKALEKITEMANEKELERINREKSIRVEENNARILRIRKCKSLEYYHDAEVLRHIGKSEEQLLKEAIDALEERIKTKDFSKPELLGFELTLVLLLPIMWVIYPIMCIYDELFGYQERKYKYRERQLSIIQNGRNLDTQQHWIYVLCAYRCHCGYLRISGEHTPLPPTKTFELECPQCNINQQVYQPSREWKYAGSMKKEDYIEHEKWIDINVFTV